MFRSINYSARFGNRSRRAESGRKRPADGSQSRFEGGSVGTVEDSDAGSVIARWAWKLLRASFKEDVTARGLGSLWESRRVVMRS